MVSVENRHKAAALLALADRETAKRILKELSREEATLLGKASLELKRLPLGEEILEELSSKVNDIASQWESLSSISEEDLANILRQSLGDDKGNEVFNTIRKSTMPDKIGQVLDAYPVDDLLFLMKDEPLQAVAILISHLSPAKASQMLDRFPEERRIEILLRMAGCGEILEEDLHQILEYIWNKVVKNLPPPAAMRSSVDPAGRIVSILKRIDPSSKDRFLSTLEETNKALADGIRERIFPFEDLATLDNRTMQKVLMNVDAGNLVTALKGASPEVSQVILSNLSKRAKENIMEEKELVGAVPLSRVKESQKKIMAFVQQMVDSGEIKLSNQEEDPLVE